MQNAPGWIEVKMFARLLLLLLVLPSDARRGWAATSTSLTRILNVSNLLDEQVYVQAILVARSFWRLRTCFVFSV